MGGGGAAVGTGVCIYQKRAKDKKQRQNEIELNEINDQRRRAEAALRPVPERQGSLSPELEDKRRWEEMRGRGPIANEYFRN